MKNLTALSALPLLILSLGACASSDNSPMTAGERISQRGGEITQYGEAWTAGSKNVRDGQRLIEKSADQLADARKKLVKAEAAQTSAQARITQAEQDNARAVQMVVDGKSVMQQSEADYAAARAGPAATTVPPRQ